MKKTWTLYRPVGKTEFELIKESGYKAFPPRLEWQPFFYPVLSIAYAEQIASKWNANDAFSGYVGYVTQFNIDEEFVGGYMIQNVGGQIHNELWIPADEMDSFNKHIIGIIKVVRRFYGSLYEGERV